VISRNSPAANIYFILNFLSNHVILFFSKFQIVANPMRLNQPITVDQT